ncbi:MAG TPA: urease subunit alpha, partial [Candidatus Angelobacter sp.]|nr:urease subunit alpha [Candidatus Angelobacter sp.]
FVSQAALESGLRERLGSRRRFIAVLHTRDVRRSSLVANTAVVPIQIDSEDGAVRLAGRLVTSSPGGRLVTSSPVSEVPLNARYLLR